MRRVFFMLFMACLSGLYAQPDSTARIDREVVLAGKTRGELPYLKYGPGVDRLGGAKMTYLDTAIFLQVVDSLNSDYIVKLSNHHKAFIPKENVQFVAGSSKPNYLLTSSLKVWGDDTQDYVAVSLDERLPYKSIQLTDPARIVVDIYGATGNTNWLTQLRSAREIKNVWHEQIEDDVFRVTIELRHAQHWGYSVSYKNKALVVGVKCQPAKLRLSGMKIAIDAGHGGVNSGAVGIKTGMKEKEVNLNIAKQLEKYLGRRGAVVLMTRVGDEDISMNDRILMLREANPDFLISIHHNAAANTKVDGVSTYYRYLGSKTLSVSVLDRMLELGLSEFGNVGSFNFSLNGPTEYPNCLVEVAFMSNEADEKRIIDPRFQRNAAKKIGKGINDWIRQSK